MTANDDLELLRFEIERIDDEIAKLAGKRVALTRRVATVKKDGGMDARDFGHEDLVTARFAKRAVDAGYPPGEARHLPRELLRVCGEIVEREVSRSTR